MFTVVEYYPPYKTRLPARLRIQERDQNIDNGSVQRDRIGITLLSQYEKALASADSFCIVSLTRRSVRLVPRRVRGFP